LFVLCNPSACLGDGVLDSHSAARQVSSSPAGRSLFLLSILLTFLPLESCGVMMCGSITYGVGGMSINPSVTDGRHRERNSTLSTFRRDLGGQGLGSVSQQLDIGNEFQPPSSEKRLAVQPCQYLTSPCDNGTARSDRVGWAHNPWPYPTRSYLTRPSPSLRASPCSGSCSGSSPTRIRLDCASRCTYFTSAPAKHAC